jgi:hypothetical protein
MTHRIQPAFVLLVHLLWPALGWAYLGPLPYECTKSTPYEKTPVSKADVIFRAKALETQGINTFMDVISVEKGEVPAGRIVFKHAIAPAMPTMPDLYFRDYYALKKGQTYLIYANKTDKQNVFTQLYIPYDFYAAWTSEKDIGQMQTEDHCGSAVVHTQP